MELISLHIPKTAGTAFRHHLQAAYGSEAVALDYGDKVTSPDSLYQTDFERWKSGNAATAASLVGFSSVHGHFWAGKYFPYFPSARKILWLRDPVRRVVSLYHFWQTPDPGDSHPTRALLIREKLSLLAFAELPNIRNQITSYFVKGYGPESFDFIGFQDRFAEDLEAFCALMGWPRQTTQVINATSTDGYTRSQPNRPTLDQIAQWNAADVDWYNAARALRLRRQPPD